MEEVHEPSGKVKQENAPFVPFMSKILTLFRWTRLLQFKQDNVLQWKIRIKHPLQGEIHSIEWN